MTSTHFDPITVQRNRFGAPERFRWQGKNYHIDMIERIWRSSQGRNSGRRIYQVRSRGQRFVLHYDQRLKRWSLARAPWRTRLGLAIQRLATHLAA